MHIILLGSFFICGGCTLISSIDVCERNSAVEHELNLRTEGRQTISTPKAAAALPTGGALVSFISSVSGASDEVRTEVRGVLLSQDGAPQPTCEQPAEYTYADSPGSEIHANASIVPPDRDDGVGLLVYSMDDESSMQVFIQQISATGCPNDVAGPLQVSTEEGPGCVALRVDDSPTEIEAERCIGNVRAIRLSDTDFAILWIALDADGPLFETVLKARVVRTSYTSYEFLPTVTATGGEPVELFSSNALIPDMTAEAVDDGRFALFWHELDAGSGTLRTEMRLFDDRLAPLTEPRTISTSASDLPEMVGLDAAFDGEHLLIAWVERDEAGVSRAMARLTDPEGQPITESFRLGTAPGGEEQSVSVTSRRRGGFASAWSETGSTSHEDSSGAGVRAVAIDQGGTVLFANRACDRSDFQLNRATLDAQRSPALTELTNGSILAAWTDAGRNGVDMSFESVRAVTLTERELFPVE